MKLEGLQLWLDPVARTGPEAMAVDEWLIELKKPILRVYQWQGKWGSCGYFDSLSKAMDSFPELNQWVRRWTGGGTVDHRSDWPYTLVIPSLNDKQRLGGLDSYRAIHRALITALEPEGVDIKLSCGSEETGVAACFENPVTYDLVDSKGGKIAGAGQKRTKSGLIHQGSVALAATDQTTKQRAERLADALAQDEWEAFQEEPPEDVLRQLLVRYEDADWLSKRP